MESRKRPLEEDGQLASSKKQALTSPSGTPLANGIADNEGPISIENVELFRKEAIYRRMRHYSRECDRSQARIRDLEQRKSTCEAGLTAMAACWTQLLETVRYLANSEPPSIDGYRDDLFDLTCHISDEALPELRTALERSVQSTRDVLTQIVQLGTTSASQRDDLARYQTVQNECISLRSELSLLRAKARESESRQEELLSALVTAEGRVARLESPMVAALNAPRVNEPAPEAEAPVVQQEAKRPESPPRLQTNGGTHPLMMEDLENWQNLARERESRIQQLEEENARLQDSINDLRMEASSPSKDAVVKSPEYKVLFDHVSHLERNATENREEVIKLRAEVSEILSKRSEFEESVNREAAKEIQELKIMLSKRDTEASRLRDQRDQQASEINERKQKDGIKLQSLEQYKELAESRSERIAVLQAELKRCKAFLAANSGDESLMQYLWGDTSESVSYLDNLKNKLAAAEARVQALEISFSRYNAEHPDVAAHMQAEAEVHEQLAIANAQLERYQAIYGDPSTLPPEVQQLEAQLRQKTEELQTLKLLDKQHQEAETSLYSELDKLSAAWETLDRQLKNKVFDLSTMEDRVHKTSLDRAKAENKFYAAMRDKEALDSERKALSRSLEKQAKAVERLVESEKSLIAQVADLEKELVCVRNIVTKYKAKVQGLEEELAEWKTRTEHEKSKVEQIQSDLRKREKSHESVKSKLRTTQEGLAKAKKDADRLATRLKLATGPTLSETDSELQEEIRKCYRVINCSTCLIRPRNTVITKCMHTFCRDCVDTRISTRQRKCPTCSLSFALSEVQPVYLQ